MRSLVPLLALGWGVSVALSAPLAAVPRPSEPPARVERLVSADTVLTPAEIAEAVGPGGDPEVGKAAIRTLAESSSANEATLWIHLLTIVEEAGPAAAPLAVRAVASGVAGYGREGTRILVEGMPAVPEGDRAPLLALAALLAEESDPQRAAELRTQFLAAYPEAPERPEVALRQARWLLSIFTRREEGLRLLEDLIVSAPEHPVIPDARRLYQVERGRR